MKGIAFKDRVVIQVFAGNGGDGCASFRREKYVPLGGPDGGDGGRGGSVFIRASKDVDSLVSLYYQPIQRAQHGGRGRGAQRTGEDGEDLILPVPCGTQAWHVPSIPPGAPVPEMEDEERHPRESVFQAERVPIGEVVSDGDTLLLARGGRGGKGNVHFKSPTNRAPTEFTRGTPGEARTIILELKTVADVGLVGYPNAGKSTLLAALTAAHPKIAPYPFTTLNPLIGTLQFEDYTSLRIADIPGLIDGAHAGVGLGHDFLRHIERSRFLVYVIDMAGIDGRDPADDFAHLREELRLYSEDLVQRPYVVVANKMDVPVAARNLEAFRRKTNLDPLPISAQTGEGLGALRELLHDWRRGRRTFVAL
ncbi:MAG: GTPase ObgE [Kiritimatiellae bacterium]|nr:GTPase ObgE [Kiritimatiellia bacterium]MDW8457955.1 GTPase ObgE [Verrucomicrobiota bacterium]